ncbi:MAG TPA: RNA 2',3'-cyclic phosphodiesterase [Polyangia bacterium]
MPRIFLALNFSVAATRKIAEEVERKKAPLAEAGFRVAWVPAANLHLTLKFLGSIGDELVDGVTGACRRVAARHPPIEAKAIGLGAFPSPQKPSVLWVGVEAPPALAALQRDVEAAMVELGFDKEERAYHPHVTVGRVKEARGSAADLWKSDALVGSSALGEIVVYESKTRSAGAEYVARARVPLGDKEKR